jgi:hypothetical protein
MGGDIPAVHAAQCHKKTHIAHKDDGVISPEK